MGWPTADCAGRVFLVAAANPATEVDLFGLNPLCAFGLMAVHSLANRNGPFRLSFLEDRLEIVGDVLGDDSEGNFIQTTFWRPLLLILTSGSDEAREAVFAVTVTRYLDSVFDWYVVKTGDTFTILVSIWIYWREELSLTQAAVFLEL